MRIAPEGWPFIAIGWVILAALAWFNPWLGLIWLPVAIWLLVFFRDPIRLGPRGDEFILAPADGVVVSVISIDEPLFIKGPATRVSIFMNIFNVHVNRYPSRGTVGFRAYVKGKFGHAMPEKASHENEQSTIGLDSPRGKLLIRQIAGLIARRIVTDHQPGTLVEQSQRLGLIRFGSRVDLFLPAGAEVAVAVGQKTRVAETVVARWK
ncbi:MAG: phosphatidylserine decarboxylase family protein [Gemmatimonadales bacterium]|nr:phosphatidylserine decarboxylase family protein [Gemmatimonadales bacterium]